MISYLTLSYLIISCLILSCPITKYHILSCPVLSYSIASNTVLSNLIKLYRILLNRILSYRILPYSLLSDNILPNLILAHLILLCISQIQYSTPTDFQWKFPLVSELSHSIVRTKLLLGNDFDVEFRTFKHKSDESLVFYRTNRTYVANSLVPYLESQALHPLPYPDRDNPDQDSYKMQIYNAWWNGYVLGYPEMFINSYCEAFHNGLDIDKKRIEMKKAKNDAMLYMKNNNLSVALIGIGLEPSITDFAWESVISNL